MAFLKSLISSLALASKSSSSPYHRHTVFYSRRFCSRPASSCEEGEEPLNITPVFRIATNHINKVALTDNNGSHTYQEILVKSLILAKKIQHKIGVNKTQERIVFLCPNNLSYVLAQWACWAAGHIAVPLSAIHPPALLSYYIQDSEAALAITCEDHTELMCSVASHLNTSLPLLVIDESWSKTSNLLARTVQDRSVQDTCSSVRVETSPLVDPMLNMLLNDCSMPPSFYQTANAMILYTSGTTGKPKGVMLSHRNIDSQARSLLSSWAWSPTDVIVHSLPLNHTHGIINALLCPFYVGAKCIMLPKFDASVVWKNLLGVNMANSERPTVFMGVPTIYSKLVEEYEAKFASNPKLKDYVRNECSNKIRLMVSGSAPLPEPLFHKWHSITGHYLLERYGMTEIGMALSNPLHGERRPGHVGLPLPDVRVRIAELKTGNGGKTYYDVFANGNSKATNVVPGRAGMNGELLVKGPSVFQSYWNRPEATEEEFTEDGWFKTGDIAQYTNGYYKILGRASADIIKSGGYKISALQIETELLAHPDIADCAVVGLSDEVWGQKVAAVIVPKKKDELNVDEVHLWCKEKLAPYMIPKEWKVLDVLPRNPMGKINKKELVQTVFPLN